MPLHSTPLLPNRPKFKRIYAQPSEATLDFLKNFARTYTPGMEIPSKKTELLLN